MRIGGLSLSHDERAMNQLAPPMPKPQAKCVGTDPRVNREPTSDNPRALARRAGTGGMQLESTDASVNSRQDSPSAGGGTQRGGVSALIH